MKITESFIEEILRTDFPNDYQSVYDDSLLLQYLDKKTKAVHLLVMAFSFFQKIGRAIAGHFFYYHSTSFQSFSYI